MLVAATTTTTTPPPPAPAVVGAVADLGGGRCGYRLTDWRSGWVRVVIVAMVMAAGVGADGAEVGARREVFRMLKRNINAGP